MTLTDLSLELIAQPNRGEFLQAELKKINHKLPAAVYLPFVNGKSLFSFNSLDSMRNYAILHIVADEAKIFQTKERAPVLLHFEAFRPEELMLEVGPERTLSQAITDNKKSKGQKSKKQAQALDLERYDNYRS